MPACRQLLFAPSTACCLRSQHTQLMFLFIVRAIDVIKKNHKQVRTGSAEAVRPSKIKNYFKLKIYKAVKCMQLNKVK